MDKNLFKTQNPESEPRNPDSTRHRRIWRRAHRPEEYLRDIAKEIAKQWGVPFPLFAPFIPPMRALLKTWEPAAEETTEYREFEDGSTLLRTVFDITNYSNHRVYGLAAALQRFFSRGDAAKTKREGFEWDILGGVLTDYARKAGLCRDSTEKLLAFRLKNSDYLTMTTWRADRVEIANLKTGRAERLELPPDEIEKVMKWSVRFHCRRGGRPLCPHDPEWREYHNLINEYEKGFNGSKV